jgi:hypothetical protein
VLLFPALAVALDRRPPRSAAHSVAGPVGTPPPTT